MILAAALQYSRMKKVHDYSRGSVRSGPKGQGTLSIGVPLFWGMISSLRDADAQAKDDVRPGVSGGS
jgi:hypothetical protein